MTPLKIAFIGAESSGKTTLAKELAARFGAIYVEEFGRTLGTFIDNKYVESDMLTIAETQVRMEAVAMRQAIRDSIDVVFCDTTPMVTEFYAKHWYGKADERIAVLANEATYDLTVLCANDIPYDDDGTRNGVEFGNAQQAEYVAKLLAGGRPWVLVRGSKQQRVEKVAAIIEGLGVAAVR